LAKIQFTCAKIEKRKVILPYKPLKQQMTRFWSQGILGVRFSFLNFANTKYFWNKIGKNKPLKVLGGSPNFPICQKVLLSPT
jgi:hypothetical protein